MTVAVMHPPIKWRRVKNLEQIKMPVVSLPAAARLPAHHTQTKLGKSSCYLDFRVYPHIDMIIKGKLCCNRSLVNLCDFDNDKS